ncbi:glucosamine inositolphosphorylceramide transferase family protein [Marinibacterium sp. SX1]|uniref:glucosamine inositolphosphorylceramide transferase family protein n=1 Tax=Marinibacterium sp. SX1 TaxID=3388424 RepID=UPI003D183F7C
MTVAIAPVSRPETPAPRRILRLALVLPEGWRGEAGCARLVETLAGADHIRIAALAECPGPPDLPGLLGRYMRAEARIFGRVAAPATPRFDAQRPGLARLDMARPAGPPGLDVVIDLAGTAPDTLAGLATSGLWRLSTADPAAGLAPAMRAAPEGAASLSALGPGGGPWQVIARAGYDTKFIATRNRAFQREKAVQLIERELARLSLGQPLSAAPAPSPEPSPEPPRPSRLPGYLARACAQAGRRLVDRLRARAGGRPGRFCLGLATGDPLDFDPASARIFDAPAGQYWADPFLVAHDTGLHAFYEVYDYATGRGHIAAGRIVDGQLTHLGPVLAPDHHLSYPFVFRHGTDILMLPESHQTGRLEIWRAVDFPMRWELQATALEGLAPADSTLVERDGQWWLFTNLCRDGFGDHCSELHLYRVDGPQLRHVTPHPLNPVVIGAGSARGGGRVFARGGRLYRTAQDNTHGTYGYGLVIAEIEALSETTYRERPVRHVTPENAGIGGLIGLHHVDALDGVVLFDMRRR